MRVGAHLLVLVLASAAGRSEIPQAVVKIPQVHGETLAGTTISLPEAFQGHSAVLVIGFTQASRDAVTLWGEWLAQGAAGKAPFVAYYEMPVLASVPKILRGFVTARIKAAVADVAKPHFLVLLDRETEWRSIAHYSAPDEAYVLLVDSQGSVRWQTHGPPTGENRAALLQKIAAFNR